MNNIVEAENLSAHYITNAFGVKREVKAVDNVTLDIKNNEIIGIAGESGCGKSTLLKVLFGKVTPPLTVVGGGVNYNVNGNKKDIFQLTDEQFRKLRWKFAAYIPQGSMNVLNPVSRIFSTFRDFYAAHRKGLSKKEIKKEVIEHLNELGLPPKVLEAYPHQLSGGMRQRVTIALATILKPDIIFADEPTTALDVIVQRGVIQLLRDIQREEKLSLVMVTHDMAIHANLTDRIAVMYAGKLIEVGTTEDIFNNPLHYYTKYLIGSLPRIGDKSHRVSTPGSPPPLDNPPAGCRFHDRCPEADPECKDIVPATMDMGNGHLVSCLKYEGRKKVEPVEEGV